MRRGFVVALVVAVVAGVAVPAVQARQQEAARADARARVAVDARMSAEMAALAAKVPDPARGAPCAPPRRGVCGTEQAARPRGTSYSRTLWGLDRAPDALAGDMLAKARAATGLPFARTCSDVQVYAAGRPAGSVRSCQVRYDHDGHSVIVFLDQETTRSARPLPTTRVEITAS